MTGVDIAEGSEKLTKKKTPLYSQLPTEHFLYFELWKWKQPKYGQVKGNQWESLLAKTKQFF